jgi:hypothetical protein
MAFAHIYFNDGTKYGAMLRRSVNLNEEADQAFSAVRDVIIQMRDGDGSQAIHYAEVTQKFGFASDAKAKAAFDELESAFSKTSGNGSVTNVRAARDQFVAKLR